MLDSICIFLSLLLPRNIYTTRLEYILYISIIMDGHAKKIKPWEACTATVAVCIHNMLESSYYVYCTSRTIS